MGNRLAQLTNTEAEIPDTGELCWVHKADTFRVSEV
jgi:hypothetical protein